MTDRSFKETPRVESDPSKGSALGLPLFVTGLLALLSFADARAGTAGTCTVPGSHAVIQDAVDDLVCTEIQLSAAVYSESIGVDRTLAISGAPAGGTVIEGRVRVFGPDTEVDLIDLLVRNSCSPAALHSTGGATLNGLGLLVEYQADLPCPLFDLGSDGFETGDTSRWDQTVN